MSNKNLKLIFLRTKLEYQVQQLGRDEFFELLKNDISWKEYNDILQESVNYGLLDSHTHSQLTHLGKATIERLESEIKNEKEDILAERKKLHNESVISEWKKKTFWLVFIFGLFGGIYSTIDLINKITTKKENNPIIENKTKPRELKIDSLKIK